MKCEKCGKEANFFYSSTVNGKHEAMPCLRAQVGGLLHFLWCLYVA